MLNFKKILLLFLIILVALITADYYLNLSSWFYYCSIIVFFVLLTYGSVCIRCGFYMSSLCSGKADERSVALTFDDGPDSEYTTTVLDILKEKKAVAAFFVVGIKAEVCPDLIKRMELEGHVIGGHSYSHHFFFDLMSAKKMKIELQHTAEIIRKITGKKIKLFRPPYGVTNPQVSRAVHAMDLYSIGWSLKSKDTGVLNVTEILNRLKKYVKPGDVILFHDNRPAVLKILKEFIEYLEQHDFNIKRLDSLLKIKAYET
jgi:peptidoglycan/xylan/chitin deacetylase (PgdA/CDA1 family)